MSSSLADLRAKKDQPASLPTRAVTICLDQKVIADIQRLSAEKGNLALAPAVDEDDKTGPPRRAGEGPNSRVAEIDAELEALYQLMRDAEGELLLRTTDGGEWIRWKDDHPARPENESDERVAYGFCNASDLLDALGTYMVAWNGDEFGPGEWDGWFKAKVAPADLGALVSAVVQMHESRISIPKSLTGSSVPRMSVIDSLSPSA